MDIYIKGTDFGAHALLHEGAELALIIDLDDFLRPIGRVGDVELHLDGAARSRRRARVCRQVEVVQGRLGFFVGFFAGVRVSEIRPVWADDSATLGLSGNRAAR